MFRWAITSLHPKSLKRHDLCETSRSYLLCFRYLTAQGNFGLWFWMYASPEVYCFTYWHDEKAKRLTTPFVAFM